MPKVCVIGEGHWGTAVASLLANNGFNVNLWCHQSNIAQSINNNHINNVYFPNIKLDNKIKAVTDFSESFKDTQWIFEAIPIKYLRNVLQQAKLYFDNRQKWVILSKGIENNTLLLPSQILDDVFQCDVQKAAVSGPSFAHDLIEKKLTAVDVAGVTEIINELKQMLESNYFKTYSSKDLIGTQVVSACKNVIAIIYGIMNGKNFSDNTKFYVFTQLISELSLLIDFLGGKKDSILSLSGIGDLSLTCFGKHSKNLKLGFELGINKSIKDVLNQYNTLPEGINTIESIHKLIKQNNLKLPLFEGIYEVVFDSKDFVEMIF